MKHPDSYKKVKGSRDQLLWSKRACCMVDAEQASTFGNYCACLYGICFAAYQKSEQYVVHYILD